MQKPILTVHTKRGTLVATIFEVTIAGRVSYKYTGKFAGCGKDLEEVKSRFVGNNFVEIV